MGFTGKTIPIDRAIENVINDLGFSDHLEWGESLEWAGSILRLMGTPQMLIKEVKCVEIEDYKGELPDGMIGIDLVRSKSTNGTTTSYNAMRYEGDPFFIGLHCKGSTSLSCNADITYQLNNNFIFTSFETGEVEIAFDKFPIDERGYPMIPDDEAVIQAISWTIAYKIAFRLFLQEKIGRDAYKEIKGEKDWYVGKAISRFKTPSKDQMETLKNMSVRLIPKMNAHASHFGKIGNQEQRINHNTNNFQQGDNTH